MKLPRVAVVLFTDMCPNLELLSLEDAKKLPMIPVARAILEDFGIHQKGVL